MNEGFVNESIHPLSPTLVALITNKLELVISIEKLTFENASSHRPYTQGMELRSFLSLNFSFFFRILG